MKSVPMRGSAGSMVRITTRSGDEVGIEERQRMACGSPGIALGIVLTRRYRVTVLTSLPNKSDLA